MKQLGLFREPSKRKASTPHERRMAALPPVHAPWPGYFERNAHGSYAENRERNAQLITLCDAKHDRERVTLNASEVTCCRCRSHLRNHPGFAVVLAEYDARGVMIPSLQV